MEVLEGRSLPSVLVVTNAHDSGKGSLRDEIAAAQDGDTIKFSAGLAGKIITLTSGEIFFDIGLDIEGLGASKLAVSGNNASGIFDIGPDASPVTIAGLTLKNGLSLAGFGGAIADDGASLTLRSDILSNDRASSPLTAEGGALAIVANATVGMTVSISNCRFANDAVIEGARGPGQKGFDNFGGAIYVEADFSAGLALAVTGTSFTSDSATGGSGGGGITTGPTTGGDGGMGQGGAVFIDAGFAAQPSFFFSNDTFSNCSATGGAGGNAVSGSNGGRGGASSGGALAYNATLAASPTLSVSTSTFSFNTALGGNGGAGGDAVDTTNAVASAGTGGTAGSAAGGAVFADFRDSAAGGDNFTADTFDLNQTAGGVCGTGGGGLAGAPGGVGGGAFGGGLAVITSGLAAGTQVTVAQSSISVNGAQGGNGGAGGVGALSGGDGGVSGAAQGGGLHLVGGIFGATRDTWTLTGDSIDLNSAITGNGGAGGAGSISGGNGGNVFGSAGGGVFAAFLHLEILNSTIIFNAVGDGAVGPGGAGFTPGSPGSSESLGDGGGLYFGVGTACADHTVIFNNSADLDTESTVMPGPC
jgi:hypothetical protein